MESETHGERRKCVLWADDSPQNNFDAVRQLRTLEVDVVQALTTKRAMEILRQEGAAIDAIVTDMYRTEEEEDRPEAGLSLVREARSAGFRGPILVSAPQREISEKLPEILRAGGDGAASSGSEVVDFLRSVGIPSGQRRSGILWVDDIPQNNIDAVRRLRALGVEVVQALTTRKAMEILRSRGGTIDAIVTDMHRTEGRKDLPEAGLSMIREARAAGFRKPILVSTPKEVADEKREAIEAAGGDGTASSGGGVLEFLRARGIS